MIVAAVAATTPVVADSRPLFSMEKTNVFLTGATGVMGFATLGELEKHFDCFNVCLLVRDSKKNRKKLAPYLDSHNVRIVWGDLLNPEDVARALGDATVVLHMGGMVSPAADYHPEATMKVNVGGTANVIAAIKNSPLADEIKLVYIGSVAQMSNRNEPFHWGRTGDPLQAASFDFYGLSKILAERMVAESGLRRWVSLRQSGILHPGLFMKAFDPIAFHIPLRGVLEWTTLEDSAVLMRRLSEDDIAESFWNKFYHIGSGRQYRLSNYDFVRLTMEAVKCPPPEKIFEPSWFATRNFHGIWFDDSDILEELVGFRKNIPLEDYFRSLASKAPWWTRLAPLAPAPVIKYVMKSVANKKPLGPLYWLKSSHCEDKINAFFGSRVQQKKIPDWPAWNLSSPSSKSIRLSHGYDESKPLESLDLEDMRKAAAFRGGRLLSEQMERGDLFTPLEWECGRNHRFMATPNLILKGGHWCPECVRLNWTEKPVDSPFLNQLKREVQTEVD